VLSHFACADQTDDTRNAEQIVAFTWARRVLSVIPRASMAASAGCFLGKSAHFDLVRPGIGLFGGNPFSARRSPFKAVAAASVPLIQVKLHRKGDYVGYGSECCLNADKLIGTISIGYADGLPRNMSNIPFNFFYHGYSVNVTGRVSMDMTLVDLTHLAHIRPKIGDEIEVYGMNQSIDDLAKKLNTIPNEILTMFARRSNLNKDSAPSRHAPSRYSAVLKKRLNATDVYN